MHVGTGKAGEVNSLLNALERGRGDQQFFSQFFLNRTLHDKQLEWAINAEATTNVLATANRWGKTTVLSHGHFHSCMYKTGAEARYFEPDGSMNLDNFLATRYQTAHTGGDWETSRLVWDEAHKILNESKTLAPFIKTKPLSLPPHISGINGFLWKFRTLGHDSRGIDGNSFYLITVDEAGWIDGLEEMLHNVIRVRIADVQGRIWIVGTFKPGVSKDFYKFAVRASAYTGAGIGFDHRSEIDDATMEAQDLDSSIKKYLAEYGIDLDEYRDAVSG